MEYDEITDKYKALNRLIITLLNISEDIKGKPIQGTHSYALMIGKKIMDHCISVLNLSSKQKYRIGNGEMIEFVDFPSIAVLTRSILESYLAFNHVYINTGSKEETDFKWLAYDLAGFYERQSFKATTSLSIEIKKEETETIEVMKKKMAKSPYFSTFSPKQQKQLLEKENWKLFQHWGDLARSAGYDPDDFNQTYKYLCSYVHSGRLCVLQILDANKHGNEINLVNANINTCCGALAKYIIDLEKLIPSTKNAYKNDPLTKAALNLWSKVV